MNSGASPLDALEAALENERQALLARDIPSLLETTQAKLDALKACEEARLDDSDAARIARLSDMNRENSVILARRRREVGFLMRTIGIMEEGSAYQANGAAALRAHTRYFGAG